MNVELKTKLENKKIEIRVRDNELVEYYNANSNILTEAEKKERRARHKELKARYAQIVEDIALYEKKCKAFKRGEIEEADLVAFERDLIAKYGIKFEKKKAKEVNRVIKAKRRTIATALAVIGGSALFGLGAFVEHTRHNNDVDITKLNVSTSMLDATLPTPTPTLENAEGETLIIEDTTVEDVIDEVVAETVVETPVVTPEPTPVATPVPTPVPTPVATPEPTPVATPEPTPVATPEPTPVPTPFATPIVLPFETYGQFMDVNDEAQLRARATWYYENYVANPNKPSNAGARNFSIEEIMNDMRMINGEFKLNADGSVTYNDMDMIDVVNDLHKIANYDSFKQYGTQIYFTPMAPLFEDGSLAQEGAMMLDNAMERVVAAIRAEDNEAFLDAARNWGYIVINMFEYLDYTGEYVSIADVEYPTSYALYHAMSAKYASTILEYSEAHHLDVCIEYCTDYNTGETKKEALSEIMYQINDVARDAVAVRSGHQDEYAENNLSLPERLFLGAKAYFNSKYETEIGYSKTMK